MLRRRVADLEQALVERDALARAAEARATLYQRVLEELPIAVAVIRGDGMIIEVNRKQREVLGLGTGENIVGKINALESQRSVDSGYAELIARALRGEAFRAPPQRYEGLQPDSPTNDIYTQPLLQPVDVDGERYVAAVNLDVTEQVEAQKKLEETSTFYEGIIDNAPFYIYVKDRDGRYLVVNDFFVQGLGAPKSALLGKTDVELFGEADAEKYGNYDRMALETGTIHREDPVMVLGEQRYTLTTKFPLKDTEGRNHAVCSISLDITSRIRAEAEAQRLQEEIIRVQGETLRALSTPLLPIADGVVVMPLIGNFTEERAQQVLETLLQGVVAHHASIVIIDVTGVPLIDTHVANGLVQAAQAVRLLGAQTILTGIQPAIARTLVDIGAELGGFVTRSTLQSGIAHALGRQAATGFRAARDPSRARR
ncbi:PAS domain-containing protein [Polyangium aurulentum]|uniref:PAS domain-containing protein n=1 Tax=Polyangium aurulentum TaxID=2567896 RepID=UPI00197E7A53|nr:PAS domain-containing protein [Polyangium aurulentum]UQA58110.1 PAS domain-containing protein [Polyangium aurulentum]